MNQLNQYERTAYSQNGEDGIIEEIFNRVPPTDKTFVEFGVERGSECNTAYLVDKGWSGLMIEGSETLFPLLQQRYEGKSVVTLNRFITKENIKSLFVEGNVKQEFDLLSIDIDGNDYWVWDELMKDYRPKVVVIEYNAFFPPGQKAVMKYNANHIWDATVYQGASLESLRLLGYRHDYALIGTDRRGVNAFFLRRDLLEQSGLRELSCVEAYSPIGYGGHRYRDGDWLEI